jgi:putative transposase
MPWKECHVMDERLRFVARLLEGEKMKPLCAEFGISRKTGYKVFNGYKDCGLEAFTDRSRRPHRQANWLPEPIEARIVHLKREYPGWGAPKIREKLRQHFTGPHLPAISTVHAVLDRHHLVNHRRRRRPRATGTELSRPTEPNALWCADYKGEFMLGNRRYCYPLTITDFASRYLLTCEALSTTQERFAFTVFERTFRQFGLPHVIRTDKRRPVCVRPRPLWAQQTLGLVAPTGHRDRTHPTRTAATKRPPRTDASDAEEGSHQAGCGECPPAAGTLRRLRRAVQPGAAPRPWP